MSNIWIYYVAEYFQIKRSLVNFDVRCNIIPSRRYGDILPSKPHPHSNQRKIQQCFSVCHNFSAMITFLQAWKWPSACIPSFPIWETQLRSEIDNIECWIANNPRSEQRFADLANLHNFEKKSRLECDSKYQFDLMAMTLAGDASSNASQGWLVSLRWGEEGMSKFSHFAQTMSDKWLESWESSKPRGFSKLLVIDVDCGETIFGCWLCW